ncbi:MAG TPA: hypothetical protein VGG30_12000 [Pirellulales bacterium]
MRRLTAVWPILLAFCLAWSSGCCCRQGYVLHGDWSLGLVRSPPQSQPPGCQCPPQGDCTDSNGCSAGNAGSSQVAGGPQVAAGKRCAVGKRRARGAQAAQAASVASGPGPTGPSQGHPRFHPVPTRPVFGSVTPPQIVPVAAPDVGEPLLTDPEEVPQPLRAPSPNSARRRPKVRHASVQMDSGFGRPAP